ncbi:MAG: ABC transporter substrate-binding protein [Gemmatimonadaceae bacterium]
MGVLIPRVFPGERTRASAARRTFRAGTFVAAVVIAATTFEACTRGDGATSTAQELRAMTWPDIEASARGQTVTVRMWRGDQSINQFMDTWVAPRLANAYGITLRTVEGQGPEIVNALMLERNAHANGTADLVWINGETFSNLRRENLLLGPWADRVPSAALLDSASPIIMRDFEQALDGYELPWGTVQAALIYDTLRTPNPPRTFDELARWIHAHQGRFTHDQAFTGVTFLKALMYSLNGGVSEFQGGFNEPVYTRASAKVWQWLNDVRGDFWRGGRSYPAGVAELHRLFANGEVDFTMSNNQNEVITKVRQGILPPSSRALVLRDGTIANAHYLGIPATAPHAAAAMVVANFLLSIEAQYEKQRPEVWADGTVLSRPRLSPDWQRRFAALARESNAIPPDTLAKYARPEIAPQYHERLSADWRDRIRDAAKR